MIRTTTTDYKRYPLKEKEVIRASVSGFTRAFFKKNKFLLKSRGVTLEAFLRDLKERYNFRTTRQFVNLLEHGNRSCSTFFLAYVCLWHGMTMQEYCSDLFSKDWDF